MPFVIHGRTEEKSDALLNRFSYQDYIAFLRFCRDGSCERFMYRLLLEECYIFTASAQEQFTFFDLNFLDFM